MTNAQMELVMDLYNYDEEVSNNRMGYAPLLKNFDIIVDKNEHLYTDINRFRYKYLSNLNMIIKARVRIYSYDITQLPSHGNYDSYSDKNHDVIIYEYMTDDDGNLLLDYYDIASIVIAMPNASKIKMEDV